MQRLLIDMDDVMADTFAKLVKTTNERRGTNWVKGEINTHELNAKFREDYEPVREMLWEKGFFADFEVMEGAQEVIEKLHKKYEIFIVSAALEFPHSLAEKLTWK